MQTSYFGHAWSHTPKMMVLTCWWLRCLSACEKYTSSFTSFLRYYILKNPTIWLADSILAHYLRIRILPDRDCCRNINNTNFHLISYFWHYSCAVIILFNTSLYGSIFSGYFLKTSFLPVCVSCFLCFSFDVIFLEFIQVFVLKLFLNVLGALWFCSHVLKLTL